MTCIEAAIEVLRRNGRPMTDEEITQQAISLGLITATGKTPRQTVSAPLYWRSKDPKSLVRHLAEHGPAGHVVAVFAGHSVRRCDVG